jgi:predicted transcriptional regulator of viral defense system
MTCKLDEIERLEDVRAETERIVALVGELGEVGPGRLGDVLAAEDPAVNKASVRAMLGQLVDAGRLTKPGRGRYAVSAG